jgi:hypothetical protein
MALDATEFVGVRETWHRDSSDDRLVRAYEQDLPLEYWRAMDWAREQDRRQKTGDTWRVASIPAVFVEKALRDGLNIYEAPLKEIVGYLHRNDLTDFLTTEKSII